MSKTPNPIRRHRRHALGLVGTFAGVLLVFSAFNTWINPLWVTPAPWTDPSFAEHRQVYSQIRTAKAGLARSLEWDVALLGSSRVAIGLDPDLPQWGDLHVVNLGLSGASITENSVMGEYAIEQQPGLKKIILGLDLTDLTSETDFARGAGFFDSPLSDRGSSFERELRYVVGFSSAEASYKTLKAKHNSTVPPPYTTKGHWAHHRSSKPVREILEKDSIPFALRYVRLRKIELELAPKKVKAFRKGLETYLRNGVETVVFIPPNHGAYLCVMPMEDDPDPFFMKDRRAIVDIVAEANAKFPNSPPVTVWDFNDFHPLNTEPIPEPGGKAMKYWVDGTHALESLGEVMLARINGWPLEDPDQANYGTIVTPETIDAREDEIRAGYERYRREQPEDIRFVKSVIRHYQATSDDPAGVE